MATTVTSLIGRKMRGPIRTLIPPRTVWDIISSSGSGLVSLLTDQEHRDTWQALTDKKIIRDFSQQREGSSDTVTGVLALALYHELDNHTLKKFGFKADEFLEGAQPALEKFHDVEGRLCNKLFQLIHPAAAASDETEAVKTEMDDATVLESTMATEADGVEAENGFSEEERESILALVEREATFVRIMAMPQDDNATGMDASSPLHNILTWNWQDSLVQDVKLMVSSDFFEAYRLNMTVDTMLLSLKGVEFQYQEDSAVVPEVSLLSARVLVDDTELQEIDYKNISEDELNVRDTEDFFTTSVVAQIEVLYVIEHVSKLRAWMRESRDGGSLLTERLVRVGVFEGYLKGTGENRVTRWKLANVRTPSEITPIDRVTLYRPK